MPTPTLSVRQLRKSYGTFEALCGVNFEVAEGEMFGLLGPNGAGKTTLLSILACLLEASSGDVQLFGTALNRHDLALRHQIGICTQDLSIYGDLTARENLQFFGKLYGLRGTALTQRVDEMLALTALHDKADLRVATYSGGMKRRLNLGVAVVHRPKVLYLDEPTTGVDPQSRNHIFEEVQALNASGVTVLYTSHYMEEVQHLCPRIAILDHGQIIACDTREQLLRRLDTRCTVRLHDGGERLAQAAQQKGLKVHRCSATECLLGSADKGALMVTIVELLRTENLPLAGLETHEPNLEQVFLHLTQKTLRD